MDNKKKLYRVLREKMKEVSSLPTNNFGKFTPYYKEIAPLFKIAPYRLGIVLAFIATFFLVFFFKSSISIIASILSRGF